MENFVLNLFSDKLSKVILNFNDARMKINASFMAGKGSITNVKLNVDLLNEILTKPPYGLLPFLCLKEATISELRLEVTSYTNLKKAPVVLVIDEVFVEAEEMMEYYFDGKHNTNCSEDSVAKNSQTNQPAPVKLSTDKLAQAKQTTYGLLHRITDNLSIRINKMYISFQPLGKFKTKRVGIWTPPAVNVTLENVEWISVTQYGEVGTPEQIWAHNDLSAQQASVRQNAAKAGGGHHHRMYTIFKRLSFKAAVGLFDRLKTAAEQAVLISDCKVDVHIAYTRRLRDAGITGVDVDLFCHDAVVNLDLSEPNATAKPLGCSFRSVLHLIAGLLHCMYKDRSFVDPLMPEGTSREPTKMIKKKPATMAEECAEDELGPDNFMPVVNMEDDDSVESCENDEEPDEEHDEAFLAWRKEQGLEADASRDMNELTPEKLHVPESDGVIAANVMPHEESSHPLASESACSKYKRKRKAVIVLASGAQKFEKLSFSFTARRVNAKLFLPREKHDVQKYKNDSSEEVLHRHCIEILAEGLALECIWPKPDGEIGGNVQCSMRYLHIMESLHRYADKENARVERYLPLIKIGCRLFDGQDVFSLASHYKYNLYTANVNHTPDDEDGFPMMERRHVSWKWTRHDISGPAALSLKSTVSFVDESLALWSKTYVIHEANIGEIEFCIDSDPVGRLAKVLKSNPFDNRWFSGDWADEITHDMLIDPDSDVSLNLQPLPGWYGSTSGKLSSLSSDLRSITARFSCVNVRMPHPIYTITSCGLADVLLCISGATLLVTSQLPIGFLTGTITATDGLSTSFPNDEEDFSCNSESLMSDPTSKFRIQATLYDFSLKVVPIPNVHSEPDVDNTNFLVAPTKITTMMSLQHKDGLGHVDVDSADSSQFIIASVLVQNLESSVVLETSLSAASTLNYHLTKIMHYVQKCAPDEHRQQSASASLVKDAITTVVCVHVSAISITLATRQSNQNSILKLCVLKLGNIEFGLESITAIRPDSKIEKSEVHKCIIGGLLIQIITNDGRLVDLMTIGMQDCTLAPEDGASEREGESIMLRACHLLGDSSSGKQSASLAVDVASAVTISLDINAIQAFCDVAINALSSSVYFYTRSDRDAFETSTQPLMAALLSFMSPAPSSYTTFIKTKAKTSFMRMLFSKISLHVTNTAAVNDKAIFTLGIVGADLTAGQIVADIHPESTILKQQCGRGDKWCSIIRRVDCIDTFYALKLEVSLMSVDGCREVMNRFSVDWNSIDGNEKVKELIDASLTVGMLMAHLGMKLYFMLPSKLSKSRVPKGTREIHSMIGRYHSDMLRIFLRSEGMIEQMSLTIFAKEKERLGLLSLVTSTMSGWLRIHEGSSLSFNRLFTTATLCRYWAVLRSSLLIFYETPSAPTPSLVFPVSDSTTSLRVITIPSTSGSSIGIVGDHLHQKGFALVDVASGIELFCVAGDRDEYKNWVSALTNQLRPDNTTQSDAHKECCHQLISIGDEGSTASPLLTAETSGDRPFTSLPSDTPNMDDAANVSVKNEAVDQIEQSVSTHAHFQANDESEIEMDTISLSGSDEVSSALDGSPFPNQNPPATQRAEHSSSLNVTPESEVPKGTIVISTREILKKSRFASTKINSALKNAKGGMLAASERGRDGLKQALEANAASLNATSQTRAEFGQKMSGLKQNANIKISKLTTAVRSNAQEHAKLPIGAPQQLADPVSSSGVDTLGSNSQVPSFHSNASLQQNRQEKIKMKLAHLDQSMSTTMRRLKIEEKLSSIGTAVRNAANEGQSVARQISSTGSVSQLKASEQRQQRSAINMGARETFWSHSHLPVRVKSIKVGGPLVVHGDDYINGKSRSLSKIEGNLIIDVHVHTAETDVSPPNDGLQLGVDEAYSALKQHFKLTSTDIETGAVSVVSRSLSELLLFYTALSEQLSTYIDCAEQVTYQHATQSISFFDQSFHKLASLERLRVSGSMLEGILGVSKSTNHVSIREGHGELVKLFLDTLVSSYLPQHAIDATKDFLCLAQVPTTAATMATGTTHYTDERFLIVDSGKAAYNKVIMPCPKDDMPRERSPIQNSKVLDTNNTATSSLLDIMMASYSRAIQERDEAFAKLASSSMLQQHEVIQKYTRNGPSANPSSSTTRNSDDELQMLCKNLGQEIELRTSAEAEVQGLKQRLELEQKLANAKERELREELEKYKSLLS